MIEINPEFVLLRILEPKDKSGLILVGSGRPKSAVALCKVVESECCSDRKGWADPKKDELVLALRNSLTPISNELGVGRDLYFTRCDGLVGFVDDIAPDTAVDLELFDVFTHEQAKLEIGHG